jgi:hypothetical protein
MTEPNFIVHTNIIHERHKTKLCSNILQFEQSYNLFYLSTLKEGKYKYEFFR